LSPPATGGDAPQGAHGRGKPPKTKRVWGPFFAWAQKLFLAPPCPSLDPLGWTLLRGLRKTFQPSALHLELKIACPALAALGDTPAKQF